MTCSDGLCETTRNGTDQENKEELQWKREKGRRYMRNRCSSVAGTVGNGVVTGMERHDGGDLHKREGEERWMVLKRHISR